MSSADFYFQPDYLVAMRAGADLAAHAPDRLGPPPLALRRGHRVGNRSQPTTSWRQTFLAGSVNAAGFKGRSAEFQNKETKEKLLFGLGFSTPRGCESSEQKKNNFLAKTEIRAMIWQLSVLRCGGA